MDANSHHLNLRAERGAADDIRLVALRAGWQDGLLGLPYSRDYDKASKGVQGSYENGRLLAVACKAAGLEFPEWPKGTLLPDWWQQVRAFRAVVPTDTILEPKKIEKPDH